MKNVATAKLIIDGIGEWKVVPDEFLLSLQNGQPDDSDRRDVPKTT